MRNYKHILGVISILKGTQTLFFTPNLVNSIAKSLEKTRENEVTGHQLHCKDMNTHYSPVLINMFS